MWKSQASDFCYLFLFFWNGNWLFIGVQCTWISRCLNLETGGLQPVCLATKSTKPNSYSSIHSGYISMVKTQMSLGPRPNRVGVNGPSWIVVPKLCFPVFFLKHKTSSALNFERVSESFVSNPEIYRTVFHQLALVRTIFIPVIRAETSLPWTCFTYHCF